ncbi:hypothetical protein ANOBCDAF_04439 [Pleomorphomonas sp. T1.2MG-36]|nr:hypothetical protein ANOBCDAF_04439 [Pleomorphomonas sp. T1.2MG-36]
MPAMPTPVESQDRLTARCSAPARPDPIRNIDTTPARHAIVAHTLAMLADLGITALCEGVETEAEFYTLRGMGAYLSRGITSASRCSRRWGCGP